MLIFLFSFIIMNEVVEEVTFQDTLTLFKKIKNLYTSVKNIITKVEPSIVETSNEEVVESPFKMNNAPEENFENIDNKEGNPETETETETEKMEDEKVVDEDESEVKPEEETSETEKEKVEEDLSTM